MNDSDQSFARNMTATSLALIVAQRDALLAACRQADEYIVHWPVSARRQRVLDAIRAAIAAVEGGAK